MPRGFVDDLPHGEGVMHTKDGAAISFTFEHGEEAGEPPCNEEYEKAVFFRRLSPDTTDATIRAALEQFGPLDYCYIATTPEGASMKIGRAKFRAVGEPGDASLDKPQRIINARQRAVDNAAAACRALDHSEVDGKAIRVEVAVHHGAVLIRQRHTMLVQKLRNLRDR